MRRNRAGSPPLPSATSPEFFAVYLLTFCSFVGLGHQQRHKTVISMSLGTKTGGEDRRLLFDARTGKFLRSDGYADKPFINRVHSGEVFGDGGLVASMLWGLALLALTVSGFTLYWRLAGANRQGRTGLRRWFF